MRQSFFDNIIHLNACWKTDEEWEAAVMTKINVAIVDDNEKMVSLLGCHITDG